MQYTLRADKLVYINQIQRALTRIPPGGDCH